MPQQRRNRTRIVFFVFLVPLVLCTCCAWGFGAGAIPVVMRQSALIFWGERAEGTLIAIKPCQSGVTISGHSGGGFELGTGSSERAMTVRVRYTDMLSQDYTGQTVACTTLDSQAAVGDRVTVWFRSDAPQDVILDKDQGLYYTLAVTMWGAVGLAGLLVVLLVLPLRRRLTEPDTTTAQIAQIYGLTDPQQLNAALHQQAIGASNYPTRSIRLKEALMLLHLRQTSSVMRDDGAFQENPVPLRDHLVLAAMLMELVLQGKIAIRRNGGLLARTSIEVIDPTPLGDRDTDDLLAMLASSGRVRLVRLYTTYTGAHHLVARLIDQLRQGDYVRLYLPTTGRFAQPRGLPTNLLGWMAMRIFGPMGFNRGAVVATDDFARALPWQYLYTTHTEGEESMFGRIQAAIATHSATDEFTRALLVLLAAHYVSINPFSRRLSAHKSIYRFYRPEEQREIHAFLRQVAEQAPESQRALYKLARKVDDNIENPPDPTP